MSIKNKIVKELLTAYLLPWQANRRQRQLKKCVAWTVAGAASVVAARSLWRKFTEYDLYGKSVLITGGSRGLGLELAREFARHGARVAICARDHEDLSNAHVELSQEGHSILALAGDLTIPENAATIVAEVKAHFGALDVLVNNAGIISVGPIEEMTIADFTEAMQTNYFASLYTTLAALPEMQARHAGRIVNIVSIGGKVSVPHLVPYSASKFALAGFSKGLRTEVKKDGIVVTTVYPGLMRTGSPRNAKFKGQHRAEYAWFSISDSLPVLSMNAQQAAREIVSACKNGTGEVVLSWPAKMAAHLHAHFPVLTEDMLGIVNQLLPRPGGIGQSSATGQESASWMSPSWVTQLNEEAALRNNQIH